MRSSERLSKLSGLTRPATTACSSVLHKIPRWLGGAISSTYAATFAQRKAPPPMLPEAPELPLPARDDAFEPDDDPAIQSGEVQSLVDEMLSQGRYALLLRPQLIGNLSKEQRKRTETAHSEGMCLVPGGQVMLHRPTVAAELEEEDSSHSTFGVCVDAYYLDRCPVTNEQYHQFVRGGGYEQMAIWDQEIWPAVLDFVDQTGHPGPRYWRNGRYPRGEHHFPVVGISWYEATAYARWAGKRLATDAEWVKAGSWPVALAGQPLLQRRYPWGEAMDHGRANLWGSGPGRTVGVDQFPGGVSVGGVQQLIGNVWEWTAESFLLDDTSEASGPLEQTNLKSIRGGAFDTYLDTQATCHFRSGDRALARKHNIGFRCAINLCDLAAPEGVCEPGLSETEESSLLETHS